MSDEKETKQALAVEQLNSELTSMTRMFHAACADLGLINEALGLDPDDGGAGPILEAIAELKAERDEWVDAGYAAAGQAPAVEAGARDERAAFESNYTGLFGKRWSVNANPLERKEDDYRWSELRDAWAIWRARAALARASEAAAGEPIYQVWIEETSSYADVTREYYLERLPSNRRVVYAAPQPASKQQAAREVSDDEFLQNAAERLSDMGYSKQADVIRAILGRKE